MMETKRSKWNRAVSDVRCWSGLCLMRLAARVTDASVYSTPDWTWKLTKSGIRRKHKLVPQREV